VVVDEPVSCMRKLMQRGARYFVGLIDAVLDDDIAIVVTMPDVHRCSNIRETKSPWPDLQLEVLDAGAACRHGHGTRQFISERGADLRPPDDRNIASRERATHPRQRLLGCALRLAQPGSDRKAHQPGSERHKALLNAVRAQHRAGRNPCFGRRGTAHDCASNHAIAQESRARCGVGSTAGIAEYRELVDTDLISEVSDIARPALIRPAGVIGAVTVTGPVGRDQPHAPARRNIRLARKLMARAPGSMECDHWRTIECAALAPRQLASVRELKQSRGAHGASCPVRARSSRTRPASIHQAPLYAPLLRSGRG
jgi:hypothetical protein